MTTFPVANLQNGLRGKADPPGTAASGLLPLQCSSKQAWLSSSHWFFLLGSQNRVVLERVSCEEKGHGALRPCSALTPSSLETEDRLTWPHPCTTKEPVLLKRCHKGEYENGLCLSIQVLVWGVLFCFVVSSLIVHKVLISRGRGRGGEGMSANTCFLSCHSVPIFPTSPPPSFRW